MSEEMNQGYPALRWQGGCLELLDQRLLPQDIRYLPLHTAAQVATAISDMVVRGAPAIGIAAAYGATIAARQLIETNNKAELRLGELEPALKVLAQSRPTAVNLHWALQRVRDVVAAGGEDIAGRLERLAVNLHEADIEANHRLGGLGAQCLPADVSIYTHCNAGALATGGYGTALGVIRSAHEQHKVRQVYAGETRPWLQGSRLTAWELQLSGIPVKLATEGAAGFLMRRGLVDWVIVGADRVARNGDVANKIGTYNLAVLARYHGVGFMVALPTSTIDMEAAGGEDIPIEERPSEEVTQFRGADIAPHGVKAVNPVFDVTPAELVDVLVTEKAVVERPDAAAIARLMAS
jgi:methylthioribose-1-phosphate isomerase